MPAVQPPQDRVETERLIATIKSLPPARSPRADVASQQGLVAAEDLLVRKLKDLGYEPRLHPCTWTIQRQLDSEKKTGAAEPSIKTTDELASHVWNSISVDLPGKELPAEVLIISAHFDAAVSAPGADDDGTGVAGILEAARVLKDCPARRTIRLMLFNLEELGLLGSKDYVRSARPRWEAGEEKIIGMVSLEMLGFFSDAEGSQTSPIGRIEGVFEPPTVGDFIGLITIAKASQFCRRFDEEMRRAAPGLKTGVADFPPVPLPDFTRSDHAPFLLAGIPALMLTDTANYRNPNYHKQTDTVETIDQARFTLVVKGVVGAAYAIAEPITQAPPAEPPK
jgi:hypothetical protein